MMEFFIESGRREKLIGNWQVKYHAPVGGIYRGRLTITDSRMMLDRELTDLSPCEDKLMKGVLDDSGYLITPREAIVSITSAGNLRKKVIVRLDGCQQYCSGPV